MSDREGTMRWQPEPGVDVETWGRMTGTPRADHHEQAEPQDRLHRSHPALILPASRARLRTCVPMHGT
jgi:hypothetical protein